MYQIAMRNLTTVDVSLFPPGFTHSKQMGNCVSSQSQQAVVEKQAATGRGRSIVSLRKVNVFLFRSLPTSSLVTLVWNKTKQTLYSVWCASSLIEKSTTKHVGWESTIGLSNASAQAQQPSSGNLNVKRYWLSKGGGIHLVVVLLRLSTVLRRHPWRIRLSLSLQHSQQIFSCNYNWKFEVFDNFGAEFVSWRWLLSFYISWTALSLSFSVRCARDVQSFKCVTFDPTFFFFFSLPPIVFRLQWRSIRFPPKTAWSSATKGQLAASATIAAAVTTPQPAHNRPTMPATTT